MIRKTGWIAGIFALALLCMAGTAAAQEDTGTGTEGTVIVDDVEPYDGPIGPGSPLYGLKIAFEDIDESFTANETDRLRKQITSTLVRLSEVRRELQLNNTDAADRALDLYRQKITSTRERLQTSAASDVPGLLHAQQMITKHQLVLEHLMDTHPNNTGLMRAYNNSLALETKFQEKTQTRFERTLQKNNETIVKAVRLEVREQQRTENTGDDQVIREQQTRTVQEGQGTGREKDTGQKQVTETPATPRSPGPDKGKSGTGQGPPVGGEDGNGGTADNRQNPGSGTTRNR